MYHKVIIVGYLGRDPEMRYTADGVPVDRSVAPSEHGQSFLLDDAIQYSLALEPRLGLDGEEHHAYAVGTLIGKHKAQFFALTDKERVRDLDGHPGPITRLRIASAGAAMGKVHEDFNTLSDDLMGFLSVQVHHEADPACIMFGPRII